MLMQILIFGSELRGESEIAVEKQPLQCEAHRDEVVHECAPVEIVVQRFIDRQRLEAVQTEIEYYLWRTENKWAYGMNEFPFIEGQIVSDEKLDVFDVGIVEEIFVFINGIKRKILPVKLLVPHHKAVPQSALGNDVFHIEREGNVDVVFYRVVRELLAENGQELVSKTCIYEIGFGIKQLRMSLLDVECNDLCGHNMRD